MKKKGKMDKLQIFLVFVAAAVIAFLVLTYNINGAIEAILHIKIIFLLEIFIVWVAFSLTKFLPWFYVMHRLKIKIPFKNSLPMSLVFFGLEMIPSGIAQFLPLRNLDRFKKGSKKMSFSIVLSLNATGALTLMAIALISSILVSRFVVYIIAVFAVPYVIFSLLRFDLFHEVIEKAIKRFKIDENRITKPIEGYLKKLRQNRGLMSQKNIMTEMLLFVPTILLEALIFYLVLLAFNQSLSFLSAVFIFSFSYTLASMSFVFIAGFGPADISMIGLSTLFGVPGVIAVSSLLLFRFFNTILYILTAYVYFYISKLIDGQ